MKYDTGVWNSLARSSEVKVEGTIYTVKWRMAVIDSAVRYVVDKHLQCSISFATH